MLFFSAQGGVIGAGSDLLKQVAIEIMTQNECRKYYNNTNFVITDQMVSVIHEPYQRWAEFLSFGRSGKNPKLPERTFFGIRFVREVLAHSGSVDSRIFEFSQQPKMRKTNVKYCETLSTQILSQRNRF